MLANSLANIECRTVNKRDLVGATSRVQLPGCPMVAAIRSSNSVELWYFKAVARSCGALFRCGGELTGSIGGENGLSDRLKIGG